VAVSDLDTGRAGALSRRHDEVPVVPDPLDLVAADDVDAEVVAWPGFVHEEQVLAALAAGKHVLCEKPLTMDGESCGSSRRVDARSCSSASCGASTPSTRASRRC